MLLGFARNPGGEALQNSGKLFSGALVPVDKKLAGIHGLRAAAAIIVMLPHVGFQLILALPHGSPAAMALSGFGVHLFFVLSAFSLFASHAGDENYPEYAIKRFFRIAPLFYAMMAFYFFTLGPQSISLAEFVLNLTFTFGLVPDALRSTVAGGWSVGVEMIFYALLPLILMICRKPGAFVVLASVGAVVSWGSYRMILDANPHREISMTNNPAFYSFSSNIAPFCLGLLAFAIYRSVRNRDLAAKVAAATSLALLILLIATPLIDETRTPNRPGAFILFALFATVTLWQALKPSWLLRTRLMQHLGERSYSLYLIQFPIIGTLHPLYKVIYKAVPLPGNWAYVICVGATVAIVAIAANVTYHLIELPGVNLGRWIVGRFRQKGPAPAVVNSNQPALVR